MTEQAQEITRFDQDMDGSMEPDESGRWVRADDHDAEVSRLSALSVTSIMLDVTPGWDGSGHEVYAKSVIDVESLLSNQGVRIEDLEGERKALAKDAERYRWLRSFKHCNAAWCFIGGGDAEKALDQSIDEAMAKS